jgi:ketosteroid isomerase-like protein
VTLDEWIEGYGRCWEEADGEALLELFTEYAVYRSHPFREPHVGHEGIRGYWRRATRTQQDVRVRMGRPFVDGRRVAVEWWATVVDEGEEITLPGCLLLRFAEDGRCQELREYWHVEPGRHEPHVGWGE